MEFLACMAAMILFFGGIYAVWMRNRHWREFQQNRAEPWQMRFRAHRGGI